MLNLLHVSALHFGPPYLPHVGQALLAIAPTLDPKIIVASGDFTQRARPEQFEAARAFLDQLPKVPLVTVPGNHDVPLYRITERLFQPHDLYRRYIHPELDTVTRVDGVTIVALDSTDPLRMITNGHIDSEQLAFAAKAFETTPSDDVRIVVAHHHFAPAPDYVRDQVMPRSKRALDRFTELKVDLILGGHLHRAYIGNSLDVYSGIDREHGIIIVQCGTSTSRRGRGREREKNSFNLIRVGREMIRITHYMYFQDAPGFAPVSRHFFPRPTRSFVEPD